MLVGESLDDLKKRWQPTGEVIHLEVETVNMTFTDYYSWTTSDFKISVDQYGNMIRDPDVFPDVVQELL